MELTPFLNENNDDDDEVLLIMAEELGVFIPYVGGVEHTNVLLPPLGTLCTVEETYVRDKSVESLCRIVAQMREQDLVEHFIPLVKRLAVGEWFTAWVFSCGLFHTLVPKVTKTKMRAIYSQLCQDDMPLVRRSTIRAIIVRHLLHLSSKLTIRQIELHDWIEALTYAFSDRLLTNCCVAVES
ncbi:hypothetical protein VNO77_27504 [Canavalia gladiata]|uniref:Uncharacterized protein n=1 Tax=Canavalia gladiata TaxID=3824 RepID=A0AAN9KUW6_CANGL